MEVTRLDPDGHVSWSCVGGADEWVGTELSFDLTDKDGETVVLFTHANWRSPSEFMAHCSAAVGVFRPQPEEPARDRQGHSLPRGLEVLTSEVEQTPVDVFKALADPSRRHLLDRLNAENGQTLRQALRRHGHGTPVRLQALGDTRGSQPGDDHPTGPREAPLPQRGTRSTTIAERWINRYDQDESEPYRT